MNIAARAVDTIGDAQILTDFQLTRISELDENLTAHFLPKLTIDRTLSRQVVSFQANKKRPFYRWYKYKEAFSASLVERFLDKEKKSNMRILDPFVGAGTTLFAGATQGHDACGIELLPVGQEIIAARKNCIGPIRLDVLQTLQRWIKELPWRTTSNRVPLNVLRITNGAYPAETEDNIERFLGALENETLPNKQVLRFALLCVLESVSFTRKDGQYLRWDHRSNRRSGSNTFNKGEILDFDEAILGKIAEIIEDASSQDASNDLFGNEAPELVGDIDVKDGSCLDLMPSLDYNNFDFIITSPPYCNRYDYTRTYALEHAVLGVTEQELIDLRQAMLSCTVENREKQLTEMNSDWSMAISICDDFPLLQEILIFLDTQKQAGALNNNGIPRMVRGYFYEMACIIQECYRVLKNGGTMVMVNDNVRYAGVSISVDTILSLIAEQLGFSVRNILVLPQNKGNSSQQMGAHGRDALRKSVYVWEKET